MYRPTVSSTIQLATTSSGSANLSNTLFVTTNQYFTNRIKGYSSIEELRADTSIPTTSVAYQALSLGFSQVGGTVPIYLGRRDASSLILTPEPVEDSKEYSVTLTVTDLNTDITTTTEAAVTSGATATAAAIATALQLVITATTGVTAVDSTGSVTVTADAGYAYSISNLTRLVDTYTTTEDAATLLAALQLENNDDWYFLECDDQTEVFQLAMAAEIEATETSDYPKMYHLSTPDADSIVAEVDPAIDIIGKLKELGYNRTASYWNDKAATLHEEIAKTVYNGQFQAGATTWKFMTNLTGVPAAADPVTGIRLSTAPQGFISDRNGNWQGVERKVNFAHGGKVASGEWIDVIRAKDWLNDTIEVELLNLLLNQPGGKVPFTAIGKQKVKNTIDGVLQRAVDLGILDGYVPTTIPEISQFPDIAARILKEVEWVGYLAGAIHFIVVNGVLTYEQEPVA